MYLVIRLIGRTDEGSARIHNHCWSSWHVSLRGNTRHMKRTCAMRVSELPRGRNLFFCGKTEQGAPSSSRRGMWCCMRQPRGGSRDTESESTRLHSRRFGSSKQRHQTHAALHSAPCRWRWPRGTLPASETERDEFLSRAPFPSKRPRLVPRFLTFHVPLSPSVCPAHNVMMGRPSWGSEDKSHQLMVMGEKAKQACRWLRPSLKRWCWIPDVKILNAFAFLGFGFSSCHLCVVRPCFGSQGLTVIIVLVE